KHVHVGLSPKHPVSRMRYRRPDRRHRGIEYVRQRENAKRPGSRWTNFTQDFGGLWCAPHFVGCFWARRVPATRLSPKNQIDRDDQEHSGCGAAAPAGKHEKGDRTSTRDQNWHEQFWRAQYTHGRIATQVEVGRPPP